MKKIYIMVVLLLALILVPQVYAYDTYQDTENIIASDSPYTVTYTIDQYAYNNYFAIHIEGSFKNVNYITFYGLDSLLMYNVNYSLGAGQKQGIKYGRGSIVTYFNEQYEDYYDVMVMDMNASSDDTEMVVLLHPDLGSGQTYADFEEAVKQHVSIFINDTLDLSVLYERAFNAGYQEGYYESDLLQEDIDILEQNAYNVGYADAQNDANQSNFEWLTSIFYMIAIVLSVELIPSVTIGAIIMIPIAIKMVPFILGLFKGGSRD